MKNTTATVLLGFVSALVGACASPVTYPAAEGAAQTTGPNVKHVTTLITEAIRYAHNRYGRGDEFAINLPPGAPPDVYDTVIQDLGAGHPMRVSGERAYHVTKVSVRGLDGTVDLMYPREEGEYELVTITFRRDLLQSWEFAGTRLWQATNQPPGPNYSPLPDDSPEPQAVSAEDSDDQ